MQALALALYNCITLARILADWRNQRCESGEQTARMPPRTKTASSLID